MQNIELIPLMQETLVEYKLLINENLLNAVADPTADMANIKQIVGQMQGAEGFALSLINILTEDETDA
jgi:hypothetical protein